MLSRGRLMVNLALQNSDLGNKECSVANRSEKIESVTRCTIQGNTIVTKLTPDITCYESDSFDSTEPSIENNDTSNTVNAQDLEVVGEESSRVYSTEETVTANDLDVLAFLIHNEDRQDSDNLVESREEILDTQADVAIERVEINTDTVEQIENKSGNTSECSERLDDPDYVPDSLDSSRDEDIRIDQEETIADAPNTKRKKSDNSNWIRNKNKQLRMCGEKYKGVKKTEGRFVYSVDRPSRTLTSSECSKICKKSKIKKCNTFTEEERQTIFNNFWKNIDWNQRKVYVNSLIATAPVKRKSKENTSRRSQSFTYSLWKEGEKVVVCKNMFLSTLGIGEKTVYGWVEKATKGISEVTDYTRKGSKRRQRNEVAINGAKDFFNSLPKMPSHYCRSSTTKLYLEPLFTTFMELFKQYKIYCTENSIEPISKKLLKTVFDEQNVCLFKPKKDQCDLCVGHETGNVNEEQYQAHIIRKDAARSAKVKDKEKSELDPSYKVVTMDVQCVLLCPRLQACALYYKTKLACHHFTIYDLGSKDVTCYFWHEGEGGLTSHIFASFIVNYIDTITSQSSVPIKHIVLFSDGCTYQNRNSVLSNALLNCAIEKGVIIEQKYLERGHTQMEVDSVHSTIENKLRKKPFYVPQNYVDIIKSARISHPYKLHYVDHSFFKDFSEINFYSSIRPGNRVGDPVVTDIRVLMYTPSGEIKYKLHYGDEPLDLPRRSRNSSVGNRTISPLYMSPCPIKASKFRHLQDLKDVIPRDFHQFYDALSHD